MKIFAFIMSLLILALSAMPCADNMNSKNKDNVKTVTPSSQQKDIPHQDDCSPFCQCSCCAGFSINHFIAAVSPLPGLDKKTTGSYLPSDVTGVIFPVWQPPQLV